MELLRKLKEQGWNISNEGLSKLPEDVDKSDTRKVIQAILDIDLRDIGVASLPAEISRKDETIPGRIVVQIAKIRNISAPKANEESKTAPRFLQLELTDGVTQAFALEFEHIASLSLNTPPGTKIFLRSDKIPLLQGLLMLRPSDVQVLGGEVAALVEKWEISRTLQKYARGGRPMATGSSGPPPWIPFGRKIQQFNDDKNFKSLGSGAAPEKEKDAKDNEFDAMRNEAIAEAAKSGARKVFGGGNQQMLDHNVKKIMERGFSELEAKNALRTTRNNLERALYNLKRRDDAVERVESKEPTTRGPVKRGTFKETKKTVKEEQVAVPTKPAGNVSLFDFLTDKLPTNAESTSERPAATATSNSYNSRPDRPPSKYDSSKTYGGGGGGGYQSQNSIPGQNSTSASSSQSNRPKFENNISSSFANRNTPASAGESDNYRTRNNRGRGGAAASYSTRYGSDMGRGGSQGMGNRNMNRPSQERERNSNYTTTSSNDGRDQRPDYRNAQENRPYKTSRFPNKPNYMNSSNNNNGPPNSNRNYSDNRNAAQQQSENDKMKDLIEDTSKLKIDNRSNRNNYQQNKPRGGGGGNPSNLQGNQKSQSQHSSKQQSIAAQQSQLQQQQQALGVYTPLPNGFAYDPNKIMGFQNKESNEYALSMLKKQSVPPASTMQAPPSAALAHYTQPPPPPQMTTLTAQSAAFHPATATGPPPQFIMQPGPPQHVQAFEMPAIDGSGFNWKTGDRCLAKYWDDGGYYAAEITGISDKTYVVLFMGYGNYEEVLKSDCIPITGNPAAIALATHHQHSVPMQQIHAMAPQASGRPGGGANASSMGGHRHRGERQMYVPPPKREA